ncbi:MAG: serine/threonine-protein kinase [Phycisphaerae bacterium]|nr:serine/threonine-protein kinase [Phycisphaerae bacterium]
MVAYLKFFTRPTQKRLNRTAWLIGQQMHTWLPGLAAAPLSWVDTRLGVRSAEIDFDFAGYLAQAVPGETWLELKNRMVDAGTSFPSDFRWRCVEDLVLATAVLERASIIHGDLSPNNIVVNLDAPPNEPALCLIDFDAFVAPVVGPDQAIDMADGGTYGTEGYCPPDLGSRAGMGDGSVAPYSDRYGRDMLILELLFMDSVLSPDDPPASWNRDRLQRWYAAWRASCDPARWQTLAHLELPEVFSLSEEQRPTSTHLAAGLGLELPASPVICTDVQTSIPVIPSIRSVSAYVQQRPSRRPAPVRVRKQSRQAPPAQSQPLRQWLVSAQVMTRTLRRKRKPAASLFSIDSPAAVQLLLVILILIFWLTLFGLLSSCHESPGGTSLFPSISRSKCLTSPSVASRPCGRLKGLKGSGVFDWPTCGRQTLPTSLSFLAVRYAPPSYPFLNGATSGMSPERILDSRSLSRKWPKKTELEIGPADPLW